MAKRKQNNYPLTTPKMHIIMLITPQKCDDKCFKLQFNENEIAKSFISKISWHDHGVQSKMELAHSSSLPKT